MRDQLVSAFSELSAPRIFAAEESSPRVELQGAVPVQHPAASCRMLETFESSSDRVAESAELSSGSAIHGVCHQPFWRSNPAVLEKQSQQLDRVESIKFAEHVEICRVGLSRVWFGLVR